MCCRSKNCPSMPADLKRCITSGICFKRLCAQTVHTPGRVSSRWQSGWRSLRTCWTGSKRRRRKSRHGWNKSADPPQEEPPPQRAAPPVSPAMPPVSRCVRLWGRGWHPCTPDRHRRCLPRFRPAYGELCWEPACSIKAQTGYNLSSRNLIWDTGRIGLVVSHNGVNDGDHLPAGVAHGRHVGLPFISFFLKIKLQRRIVKHRR